MKAFIVDRYGTKEGGRLAEVPEPELRDDDVLVQVHAAGVNPLDSKIRKGEFKVVLPYRFPLILGNEAAGIVIRPEPKIWANPLLGGQVEWGPERSRGGSLPL